MIFLEFDKQYQPWKLTPVNFEKFERNYVLKHVESFEIFENLIFLKNWKFDNVKKTKIFELSKY